MVKKQEPRIAPKEIAGYLLDSLGVDHLNKAFDPGNPADLLTLARWGRSEVEAAAAKALEAKGLDVPIRIKDEALAAWIGEQISPHPDRFAALALAAKELEGHKLLKEAAKLQGCGDPWGRVVRLFWKSGEKEKSKTIGLHSCKSRHCPKCGKRKQFERADQIEKVLELAKEWGFKTNHVRFLTLTVKNGADIPSLRAKAHEAWKKMQGNRWWGRNVFGWFRGTECVTGEDGNWNFHLHVVLVLWSDRMSYAKLWDEWEKAVGERSQVDIDRLHGNKAREARDKGGMGAAARYVSKYIGKTEEVSNLRKGPGGLAHYASSMGRLRAFAMGGGASVLRRVAAVMLPNWARRVEGLLEDAYLRDGLPAYRMEEVDPLTGEAVDVPVWSPGLTDDHRHAEALARYLSHHHEAGDRTIGVVCGPKGRWRRIGSLPIKGEARRVKDHLAKKPLDPLRAMIGEWKIWKTVEVKIGKDGKPKESAYRVVGPAQRFAWRNVQARLWDAINSDQSPWAVRRREAFTAWAAARIGEQERRDAARALADGLGPAFRRAQAQAQERVDTYRSRVWRKVDGDVDRFMAVMGQQVNHDAALSIDPLGPAALGLRLQQGQGIDWQAWDERMADRAAEKF